MKTLIILIYIFHPYQVFPPLETVILNSSFFGIYS